MVNLKYEIVSSGFYWKAVLVSLVNFVKSVNNVFKLNALRCTFNKVKIKKFTVLRPPFVNKKSREQLQYKKYKVAAIYNFNLWKSEDLLLLKYFSLFLKKNLVSGYTGFIVKKVYSKF